MRIVKCSGPETDRARYGSRFFYCGREFAGYQASVLANWHTTHGKCKVCRVQHTVAESIECSRRDLWHALERRDAEILAALDQLHPDSILGCWCVSTPHAEKCDSCHCGVIARAWLWLQQQNPG